MTKRAIARHSLLYPGFAVLFLFGARIALAQGFPGQSAQEVFPVLVMVARSDPADPTRYLDVAGDDLANAVAIFENGLRVRTTVPLTLRHGDEIETGPDVIAVLRYPAGDVYVDTATRLRIGSLDVLFGKVFARVRGLFSVENQNVVAGVEGTEFAFEASAQGRMEVTVLDGIVNCSSKSLPWRPVRVTRNQAFSVNDSGSELRVGPAPVAKLAQLRRWVQVVDDAVKASAPPPLPQPTPVAPEPVPVQPQQPAYSGYCCMNGQLYPGNVQDCRGTFYYDLGRAQASCAFVQQPGQLSPPIIVPPPLRPPERLPRPPVQPPQSGQSEPPPPPPQQQGYCCFNGDVSATNRDRCRGTFYIDAASARRLCTPKTTTGYCCAAGAISQTNRELCRGQFFTDPAAAKKACTPVVERGYCCSAGKVTQSTRANCQGTFAQSQAEAQRACKNVILDKPPVTQSPKTGSDVVKREGGIIQKAPEPAPVLR